VAAAAQRIVVQATAAEKKAIVAKARKLGLPTSELMRRGAAAYGSAAADEELGLLADSARSAAERAVAAIDDALAFVEASNRRIAAMEHKAAAAATVAARSRIKKAA
jgi:anti-sigma-K factor RskA